MRYGKVSTAVLDRSVTRPLKDAAKKKNGPPAFVSSMQADTIGGLCDPTVEMLLAGTVNDLLAKGADPDNISLETGIVIPDVMLEEQLRSVMQRINIFCTSHGIRVTGGHTQVSPAVTTPVLSCSAFAPVRAEMASNGAVGSMDTGTNRFKGWEMIMTGYAGWAGTAVLAKAGETQLKKRFPSVFIEESIRFKNDLMITDVVKAVGNECLIHDISRGGVFGSLWEMSQGLKFGFDADIRMIPIRQETIEICEYYDLNPYQLYGCGAALIIAPPENGVSLKLMRAGIHCAVIGKVTEWPARTMKSGEEVRFLDKPAQDMLNLLNERCEGKF